jgi:hypothetical protein
VDCASAAGASPASNTIASAAIRVEKTCVIADVLVL